MTSQETLRAEDFESWEAVAQAGARLALRAADAGELSSITNIVDCGPFGGMPASQMLLRCCALISREHRVRFLGEIPRQGNMGHPGEIPG